MKKIIMFTTICMIAISSFAQEPELSRREMRKLERELRKQQKAEEAARKSEIVHQMVHHGRFVLEAERMRDKEGNTEIVSPTINFVAADSVSGILQIGSYNYVGLNGVGGITEEGPISSYEYSLNKRNGNYYVTYQLRTTTDTYNITMTVYPEGRADATVSSSWPGQLYYMGTLVSPSSSRVYKGTTRY